MTIKITLLIISISLMTLIGLFLWLIQNIRKKKIVIMDTQSKSNAFAGFQQVHVGMQAENPKEKYANAKLLPEQQEELLNKLITHLEKHKSYRKQELTLRGLAKEVNIPAHLISQIINEQTEAGFIHFINQYRVQEAIDKLTDARQQHINIEKIGKQVGFNSKSTFYAAFKKYTGSSPGDFRAKRHIF